MPSAARGATEAAEAAEAAREALRSPTDSDTPAAVTVVTPVRRLAVVATAGGVVRAATHRSTTPLQQLVPSAESADLAATGVGTPVMAERAVPAVQRPRPEREMPQVPVEEKGAVPLGREATEATAAKRSVKPVTRPVVMAAMAVTEAIAAAGQATGVRQQPGESETRTEETGVTVGQLHHSYLLPTTQKNGPKRSPRTHFDSAVAAAAGWRRQPAQAPPPTDSPARPGYHTRLRADLTTATASITQPLREAAEAPWCPEDSEGTVGGRYVPQMPSGIRATP